MTALNLTMPLPKAMAIGLSVGELEGVAEHFLSVVGENAAGDMHRLVKLFNCDVKVTDAIELASGVHGTVEVRGKKDWTVYLPEHTGPLQDRFTLAHELGHYVLHSRLGRVAIQASRTFNSAEEPDAAEKEADAFALALLMPKLAVDSAIEKYGEDVQLLAAIFSVEPPVADTRLKSLGSV